MNKLRIIIAFIIALLAGGVAHAASAYDLAPAACGFNTYGGCIVYTDSATRLDLSWNQNGSLVLSIVPVNADGTYGAVVDTYRGNAGGDPRLGVNGAVLTDAGGNAAQLSGDFATRRTCVGSGRGQHCTVYVTFLGGSAAL